MRVGGQVSSPNPSTYSPVPTPPWSWQCLSLEGPGSKGLHDHPACDRLPCSQWTGARLPEPRGSAAFWGPPPVNAQSHVVSTISVALPRDIWGPPSMPQSTGWLLLTLPPQPLMPSGLWCGHSSLSGGRRPHQSLPPPQTQAATAMVVSGELQGQFCFSWPQVFFPGLAPLTLRCPVK